MPVKMLELVQSKTIIKKAALYSSALRSYIKLDYSVPAIMPKSLNSANWHSRFYKLKQEVFHLTPDRP
jgi:hypothetical protein